MNEITYKIQIDKVTPNPEYKKPGSLNDVYNQSYKIPELIYEKSLTVELTEEEFKAIKKAAIEIM